MVITKVKKLHNTEWQYYHRMAVYYYGKKVYNIDRWKLQSKKFVQICPFPLPVCSLLCFLRKYLVVKVFLHTSHSQLLLSWSLPGLSARSSCFMDASSSLQGFDGCEGLMATWKLRIYKIFKLPCQVHMQIMLPNVTKFLPFYGILPAYIRTNIKYSEKYTILPILITTFTICHLILQSLIKFGQFYALFQYFTNIFKGQASNRRFAKCHHIIPNLDKF